MPILMPGNMSESTQDLRVDLIIDQNDKASFIIEGQLPDDIVSVLYYSTQKIVMFSFADNAIEDYMVEVEIPDAAVSAIRNTAQIMIIHTKGAEILGGFEVPAIIIG